ncbi:hypothetical protein FOZ60_009856 [Perkinsus olseni]|uniref:Uncharacterized protein n=1 Tax=Perkinsus olseni TaxID=32597 RepID=A0A7J6PNR0_PEROL|nr:hypothetical protein FOZ60_009856 [Perkinsus olseni]
MGALLDSRPVVENMKRQVAQFPQGAETLTRIQPFPSMALNQIHCRIAKNRLLLEHIIRILCLSRHDR